MAMDVRSERPLARAPGRVLSTIEGHVAIESRADHAAPSVTRDELNGALERGEFRLEYQPVIELASGRVAAVEALVRWRHPQRGMLAPGAFIPLAEETGAIEEIGDWVLREATRQTRGWQQQATANRSLQVFVNVSSRELADAGFVARIERALDGSGMDPARLVLEVRDSGSPADFGAACETLRATRQLGLQASVEDVATGRGSMLYLREGLVDMVKIDRAFIAGFSRSADEQAVVRSLVGMARDLGLRSVAKGVESAEQVAQLDAAGCDLVQGFHFSKPLGHVGIAALLRRQRRVPVRIGSV